MAVFKDLGMGCLGWVIRNNTGQIQIQFSGLVACFDANEAKAYAMLMGCHELQKIGGYKAIIEGDSFSAIQWGAGKVKCPCHLADWIEEVHLIAR